MTSQSGNDPRQLYSALDALREKDRILLAQYQDVEAVRECPEPVQEFVREGRSTGQYLVLYPDRTVAQGILDYWANMCLMAGCKRPEALLDDFDPTKVSAADLVMSRTLRTAVEGWSKHGKPPGLLWDKQMVGQAEHLPLNPIEREFLQASRRHEEQRRRRLVSLLLLASSLAAFAGGLAAAAFIILGTSLPLPWLRSNADTKVASMNQMEEQVRKDPGVASDEKLEDLTRLYDGAVRYYTWVLLWDRESKEVYLGLADANLTWARTYELLRTAGPTEKLKAEPTGGLLASPSYLHFASGRFYQGIGNIYQAIDHGYSQCEGAYQVGKSFNEREDSVAARNVFLSAIDDPRDDQGGQPGARFYLGLADTYDKENPKEGAEASYIKAVQLAADDSGRLPPCGTDNELPACIKADEQMTCVDKETLGRAYLGLTETYRSRGDLARASACLRMAEASGADDIEQWRPKVDRLSRDPLEAGTECIPLDSSQ